MSLLNPKTKTVQGKPGEGPVGQLARTREDARKVRHDELVEALRSSTGVLAGLVESVAGVRLKAARPVPVTGDLVQRIAASNTCLLGWSLSNRSATGFTVRIRAGRDTSGDIIASVVISAWSSSNIRIGSDSGVQVGADGMTLELLDGATAGKLEGSIHLSAAG